MNLVEDKIVHLLTGKPNLSQVTVDELLAITDEQPFFSVAQLLLTQKMKQVNHPGFTHQLQKTALFFPNTFWLDQHLQAQPDAGYSQPAPAANTYTPPPAYTPAPAVTPSYTPAPAETPKPSSFESNPYAPPGYTPSPEVSSAATQQEQPWYNNPAYHKEPAFPAASAPAPEIPATPAAPPAQSKSINDAYAAYLPQQDVLSKVSGNTPPATPPPASTPPAYTPPDSGYTPGSSYSPAASYTPGASYTPDSSYTPGASYTPSSSYTPESSGSASSYTPDTSYNPASSYTPASAYAPAPSNTPESSYTPASSYMPADSYNPGQPTPSAAPPAAEPVSAQPAANEPWYANPAYQQPAETPAPAQTPPAPSSVNDAYSAYMPQGFSAPAPSAPAETPAPSYTPSASYTPPSATDGYAPPPTIDRYTPSAESYAPASSYTPADNSGYAPPPTMDRYAPSEPASPYTPPPSAPAPLPEPAAEETKIYDPWYTNPIYQQPYQEPGGNTLPETQVEETAPAEEGSALPATAETVVPEEQPPVSVTEAETPAETETIQITEAIITAPESIEVIAQQEEPVATAYPAPAEPVQEASAAVDAFIPAAVAEIPAPETTQEQPAGVQEQQITDASGPYRLSRPPVIEVAEENTAAKAEPESSTEPAEGTSAQETPAAETPVYAATDQDFAAAGIVEVTSASPQEALPPLDDNTDGPELPGGEESTFSGSRLSEMLSSHAASLKSPLDNNAKLPFGLEPYMIDYFASQGINLEEVLEATADDTLGKKVRKFTDWLRQMRRINPHPNDLGTDPGKEQEVQGIAALSIEAREILTESMADVLVKQGKHDKAIQLYSKLSFLNPAKTAYFASKIIETSKLSGK